MVRNSNNLQGLQVPPATASAVQENRFYINNDGSEQPVLVERQEGNSNTRVVINVPRPAAAAVPSAPAKPAPAPAAPRPAARPAASGSNNTTAPASPAPARTTTTAVAKPAAQPARVYDAYWVQTGSFSAKVRADGVKENLASRGITAIIENRDVEGRTFYRVRVGPYTSQNEADYWLSLIKSINGFEDSQVWKSQARR
jgi:DedD protein